MSYYYPSSSGEARGHHHPLQTSPFISVHSSSLFISVHSYGSNTNTSQHFLNSDDQSLAKTILCFTLCAVLALLSQVINNPTDIGHHHDLQWFSFFLSLAFGTSLAALSLHQERGRAVAIFRCLSVASTVLAFASIVSLFVESRFRAAVYGLCAVPLCASLPVPWEDLIKQLIRTTWWKRKELDGRDIEMGRGDDESSVSIG